MSPPCEHLNSSPHESPPSERAGPLRKRKLKAVVFCLLAVLEITPVLGQLVNRHLSLGITCESVWENPHGQWLNVRLHLVYDYIETDTCFGIPDSEYCMWYGGYFDHLVLEDLDEPHYSCMEIPFRNLFEDPDNGDGVLGTWTYERNPAGCELDTHRVHICAVAVTEHHWHCEACVLTTVPNCGRWRIHYVGDDNCWWLFCGALGDPEQGFRDDRCVLVRPWGCPDAVCAGVDTNLCSYIHNTHPPALIEDYADVPGLPPCPEPPPPPGYPSLKFVGYRKPNGHDGKDWLPSPKDSIALLFQVTADPPGSEWRIGYRVWDISMWQGECMNSPRYDGSTALGQPDPEPKPKGFNWRRLKCDSLEKMFPSWDFTVGEPCRDTIMYVKDTLTLVGAAPANPWYMYPDTLRQWVRPQVPFPQGRPLFLSIVNISHTGTAPYDTLWLRSHDYAAHCLVTPVVGLEKGGRELHMEAWDAPFNQRVYTITVPYDYDGYADVGLNFGDGINDIWEENRCGCHDIRQFRPFVAVRPLGPADFDHVPVGRGIDGDSWCNFAEYRGVVVRRDSTFLQPSPPRYVRLDPVRKTVLVHVRNNTDDTDNKMWRDLMPGYIYNLYRDTLEIYFTDSIRFQRQKTPVAASVTEVTTRPYLWGRDVNFNRAGAGLWYYGFGYPISKPMEGDDTIRAVTYWKWYDGCEEEPIVGLGINFHEAIWNSPSDPVHNTSGVPDVTSRIVLFMRNYLSIRDSDYADDSTHQWSRDFPRECRKTIAHEFGHSVGMLEIPYDCRSAASAPPMMAGACLSNHRFWIGDSTYSATSKDEFSTREPRR